MGVNTGKALAAENRRSQVLQMKMAGATETAIAEQVGVSKTQVHNDIHRRLAEVRRDDKEAVQQEYNLQRTRYERLLLRWWSQAIGSDDEQAANGTRQCLKIMGQMNKIGGLEPDKPLIQFNEFTQINNGMTTFADLLKEATNGTDTEGTVVEGTINGHSD